MKTQRLILLLLSVVLLATMSVACKHTSIPQGEEEIFQQAIKEYYETQVNYYDYGFWKKENKIRILHEVPFSNALEEEENDKTPKISHFVECEKSTQDEISKLQKEFVTYFFKVYNVNLENKINNQKVVFYSPFFKDEETLGFNEEHTIYISERLIDEKQLTERLAEVYFRETLYQIGFNKTKGKTITSTIVELIVEDICRETEHYMGNIESSTLAMKIAKQICKADPQLVVLYVENAEFDILEHIDKKLKDVPREYYQERNLGKRLENLMKGAQKEGLTAEFRFELQDIVRAYCQECNPDEETIDFIRREYIILEYEYLGIIENEEEENKVE